MRLLPVPFRPGARPVACLVLASCGGAGLNTPAAAAPPAPAPAVGALAAAQESPRCIVSPRSPHGLRVVAEAAVDSLVEELRRAGEVTVLSEAEWYRPGEPFLLAEPYELLIAFPEETERTLAPDSLTLLGLVEGLPVYVRREDVVDLDSLLALHGDAPLALDELQYRPGADQLLEPLNEVFLPVDYVGCVFVLATVEREPLQTAAVSREETVVSFPPPPSDHLLIPVETLTSDTTVGGAAEELHDRLVSSGHGRILFVPVPGGLAVVAAAPEGLAGGEEAGGAGAGEESDPPLLASMFSSFVELARHLFQGRPGEHRALALVLSDQDWEFDADARAYADLEAWREGGALTVPAEFHDLPLTPAHQLVAALYLFRQATVGDPPTLVTDPSVSARAYLQEVGLLPEPEDGS